MDTPKHLRDLLSPDTTTRERAYCHLEDTLYHQGIVYVATPAAVPFLIEIAASEETPEPEYALALLTLFLEASSECMSMIRHAPSFLALEALKERLRTPEFQAAIRRCAIDYRAEALLTDLRARVRRGREVYLRRMETGTGAVRRQVAELLSYLPEERESSFPTLETALDDPLDARTRACVLYAMCWLVPRDPPASRLRAAFDEEEDPLVRILLAMLLLLAEAGASPPSARRLARDTILTADKALTFAYGDLPRGGFLAEDLAIALGVADPAMGRELLSELLRAKAFIRQDRAFAILFLARKEGDVPFPSGAITPLMRDAIDVIARKAFMTVKPLATLQANHRRTYIIEVLRWFGLPQSPEGLRKLCGLPEPSGGTGAD